MKKRGFLPAIYTFGRCLFLLSILHIGVAVSSGFAQNNVHQLLVNADNLVRTGYLQDALMQYDVAISKDPDFVDAYMRRALLLSRMGRIAEAMQDYAMAQQIDPYIVEVFDISGRIRKTYVLKGMDDKQRQDPTTLLIAVSDTLSTEVGKTADNYILSGNLRMIIGQYANAIEDYSVAIRYDPNAQDAYFNRGIAHILLNHRLEGCRDFDRAYELGATRVEEKKRIFCRF